MAEISILPFELWGIIALYLSQYAVPRDLLNTSYMMWKKMRGSAIVGQVGGSKVARMLQRHLWETEPRCLSISWHCPLHTLKLNTLHRLQLIDITMPLDCVSSFVSGLVTLGAPSLLHTVSLTFLPCKRPCVVKNWGERVLFSVQNTSLHFDRFADITQADFKGVLQCLLLGANRLLCTQTLFLGIQNCTSLCQYKMPLVMQQVVVEQPLLQRLHLCTYNSTCEQWSDNELSLLHDSHPTRNPFTVSLSSNQGFFVNAS